MQRFCGVQLVDWMCVFATCAKVGFVDFNGTLIFGVKVYIEVVMCVSHLPNFSLRLF